MVSLQALVVSLALVGGGGGRDIVLLDFTAEWCQPCKQMAPVVQRLEDAGFPIQRIDVDRQPQLARQFNVQGIPCFVLIEDGKEIERVQGPASFDLLARLFERNGVRSADEPLVRGQSPDDQSSDSERWSPVTSEAPQQASTYSQDISPQSKMDEAAQRALAASVRLRIEEPNGQAFATGTIIDVHGDEALVVTCGHLFRDSKGKGNLTVELLAPGASGTVPGTLIRYDAEDRDIALVAIRPNMSVTPAPVASGVQGIARGAEVFSVGCDHGKEPTVIASRITATDKYVGRNGYAHNIEVAGQPVDGRSGGGLFNARGELIGICNAADPADNEGIYAGLKTIHEELDAIDLARVYRSPASEAADIATAPAPVQPAGFVQPPPEQAGAAAASTAGVPNLIAALQSDAEVICIVRPRNQAEGQVIVLDHASRELLTRLASERAAANIASTADSEPTVRAQNGRYR